jgi:hypothetical protein
MAEASAIGSAGLPVGLDSLRPYVCYISKPHCGFGADELVPLEEFTGEGKIELVNRTDCLRRITHR